MTKSRKTAGLLPAAMAIVMVLILTMTGCSRTAQTAPAPPKIASRSSAAGFLVSKAEESGGFIGIPVQREKASEYAYLYDNALAVIIMSRAGEQSTAEMIADAIVFAQSHDRTFKDGRLRNVYIAGDPRSDSGRTLTPGNVTIRLPGFWEDGKWQEELFTVSTSTGNMAWAVTALCAAAENASDEKRTEYLNAAMSAADFVLTLKSDNGGFNAGYEGWDDDQTMVGYQSTEHNITLAYAFDALSAAVAGSDPAKAETYADAAKYAKDFVFSMYDKKLHCFYTGTKADGKTVSDGVIPLDTNSLSILAFGEELENTFQIVSFVEDRMAVGDGFDFSAGDLDGIWNEGTAQMAVCYKILENTEKYETVMAYLKTQTNADGCIPAADRDGVSTGFVIDGTDTLWEYDNTLSIGATCWLAFAQLGINPFGAVSE